GSTRSWSAWKAPSRSSRSFDPGRRWQSRGRVPIMTASPCASRRWSLSVFPLRSVLAFALASTPALTYAADPWVVYKGGDGPGKGKHIVLISGDEEYRSEEALPQLAKILAKQHGFQCTVLFAIDPTTGFINPNVNNNIPGLEALKTADLM